MEKFCLITGASSGLGKDLSILLAKENKNLLLVASNLEKLNKAKEEITKINDKIKIETLAYDLSVKENLEKIYKYTKEKNNFINFVINSAGFGDRTDFVDMDIDFELKMNEVNINALTYFSNVYLDDMKKYREGNILNISSIAAFMAGPYMATYHASKAYVLLLSEAIYYELKKYNINVTCICPGPFKSNFVNIAKNDFTFKKMKPISSEKAALISLKALKKKKPLKIIGFKNKLMIFALRLVPRKLVYSISAHSLKKF